MNEKKDENKKNTNPDANPGGKVYDASGAIDYRSVQDLRDYKEEIIGDVTTRIEENVGNMLSDMNKMLDNNFKLLEEKYLPTLYARTEENKGKIAKVDKLAKSNRNAHRLKFMFMEKSFVIWYVLSVVSCFVFLAGMVYWYKSAVLQATITYLGVGWLAFFSALAMVLIATSTLKIKKLPKFPKFLSRKSKKESKKVNDKMDDEDEKDESFLWGE